MVGGGRPLLREILGQPMPVGPNYRCRNDWWGTTFSTGNFESKWLHWSEVWTI